MPSFTLTELCDAIRAKGEYENSSIFTDAFLTDWVNEAIAELVELVGDQFAGYYATSSTVVTVANTQTVSLPATFKDLLALDYQQDVTHHTPLRRINLGETYHYQGTGKPRAYMLHGGTAPGTIRLFPVPDAVYTLRVTFEPLFTQLSAGSDSFDFRNGWEDYVHQLVLLQCDMREERSVQERLMKIERAKSRIIGSAQKRNSAEPEHLVDWAAVPAIGEEFMP